MTVGAEVLRAAMLSTFENGMKRVTGMEEMGLGKTVPTGWEM